MYNLKILLAFVLVAFNFGCSTLMKKTDFTVQKNITYKTLGTQELKGDFYLPEGGEKKPAVIVVHGGGWDTRAGQMREICLDLARSGFVVYNITYRLAPASLYPASVEDVRDAIQFVYDHADQYLVDRERLGAWGYSAGAHLVSLVGLNPANHIKSVVAGGTPGDFLAWPHSPIVGKYIGKTLQEAPDTWKEASPVYHIRSDSPPMFFYHGRLDHLVEVEQMYKMKAALDAKHVEVETYEAHWLGHIFTYLFSQKSIDLGVNFLEKHLALRYK